MERIICARCKAIHRNSANERCPVCGAELLTPQQWSTMRQVIQTKQIKELSQKSEPVASWKLKFILGIAIGCIAFAIIVFLAKM